MAGRQHVALEVRATPEEHRLATSNPEELPRIDAEEIRRGVKEAVGALVAALAVSLRRLDPEPLKDVAAGAALETLAAEVEHRQVSGTGSLLACRHRLHDVDGDWLAGQATASAELAWIQREVGAEDGWSAPEGEAWTEWVQLRLVREGRRWRVVDLLRVRGGGAA